MRAGNDTNLDLSVESRQIPSQVCNSAFKCIDVSPIAPADCRNQNLPWNGLSLIDEGAQRGVIESADYVRQIHIEQPLRDVLRRYI